MKFYAYLFILLTAISCSGGDKLKDDSKDKGSQNIVRIPSIENQTFTRIASEDLLTVSVGPIRNSLGDVVADGQRFRISSMDPDIKFEASNTLVKELITQSNGGSFSFNVKVPTTAKQYSVQIQGLDIDSSVGFLYIKVTPEAIHSLGEIKTDVFEDKTPYNRIKDSDEKYAIVKNIPVQISIGPIVDKYGNLIQEGQVDSIVKGGIILDKLLNGAATNKARIDIVNGYARFSATTEIDSGVTFVGGKVGGEPDLEILEVIDSVPEGSPELEGMIDTRAELTILRSILNVNFESDFGVVYIGKEQVKTMTLQNLGNTAIYNRTTVIDPPFSQRGGTCEDKVTLLPLESCTIQVGFNAQIRIHAVGQVYINGTYGNQELEEQRIQAQAQASLPPSLKIDLEDNLVSFSSQPVGELSSRPITIINTGDVAASNIQFNAPPAYNGTSEGYYVFRSPPSSVPNENPEMGEHCGQVFNPQIKCIIYVDFLPKSRVPSDIISGTLSFDGGDPVSIFVKGKSYVNNFEQNIRISSTTTKINKDEIDSLNIVVGPIRDLYGEPVPNQNILISVYREKETVNGIEKISVGQISSQSQIIGGPSGYIVLRTNESGYTDFNIKSKIKDDVGLFTIKAQIIDEDSNILTEGQAEYEFIGVRLAFELDTYNFLNYIVNNEKTMSAVLRNTGTLDSRNVKATIKGNPSAYSIKEEGTCSGIRNGALDLDIGQSCELTIAFKPTSRTNYLDEITLASSSIGNKQYSALFGKGISPATLITNDGRIVGTHAIEGDKFSGRVSFSNAGDESAINFEARTLHENQSFRFTFEGCIQPSLEPSKRCFVSFVYDPQVAIPNQELITTIEVSAYGSNAGNLTKIQIPLQIYHSSLVFESEQRGVNKDDCYPLQIKGFDSAENLLDFSNDIYLTLSSEAENSEFYSDPNCANPTTEVIMPSNSYITHPFYYKSPNGGTTEVIRATSTQLSQAVKSHKIYKDPVALEVVSGDSQKGETSKLLAAPIKFRAIDEDNNGVPFIPTFVDILEDMEKKTQMINNGTFNNDISSWTVINGEVEWFRGSGGSIRLISQESVAEARSFPILVDPNTTYYYSVKVAEATGLPEAAYIHVSIEDENSNVLDEKVVNGVISKVFSYRTLPSASRLFVRIKTAGKTPSTTVHIDSVLFTEELDVSNGSIVQFGLIPEVQPMYGSEDYMGDISFTYEGAQMAITPVFRASSEYPTLGGEELLMNAQVDYPTNIKGELGDLELKSTGPVLNKNGANNLERLTSLEGYSWDSASRTLRLPIGRVYDFNSIKQDSGTTIKFIPLKERMKNEWTQVYARQTCILDGKIESNGLYTNGEESIVKMLGLDGEDIQAVSPSYAGGTSGSGYTMVTELDVERSAVNTNKTEILYTNSTTGSLFLKGNIKITDTAGEGYVENIDIYVGDSLVKKINGKFFNLPVNVFLDNEELLPNKNIRVVWFGGGNLAKVNTEIDVRRWNAFSSGLNGGAGGYYTYRRVRKCSRTYNWLPTYCHAWQGKYLYAGYTQVLPKTNTQPPGTQYRGGRGAKGRPGIAAGASTSNPANFAPGETEGGLTGARGKDGGNLFIHCYAGLRGSGSIEAVGSNGENGTNGVNGTVSETSLFCAGTSKGKCSDERSYVRVNGGGGGGSGGNGGHGGNIVLKSRLFDHNLLIKTQGGTGGNAGQGGTFWSNHGNAQPGQPGIRGSNGQDGTCRGFDSISNEEIGCN